MTASLHKPLSLTSTYITSLTVLCSILHLRPHVSALQIIVKCAGEACYGPVAGHCKVCPVGLLWASHRSLNSVPGRPVMGQSQVIV